MDDRRAAARLALSLVEGVARGDEAADGLLSDTFDNVDQAAHAHAYLAGFVLELLADERDESVAETARHVRRMIDRS